MVFGKRKNLEFSSFFVAIGNKKQLWDAGFSSTYAEPMRNSFRKIGDSCRNHGGFGQQKRMVLGLSAHRRRKRRS